MNIEMTDIRLTGDDLKARAGARIETVNIDLLAALIDVVAPLSDEGRGLKFRAFGTSAVGTPSLRAHSIKLI